MLVGQSYIYIYMEKVVRSVQQNRYRPGVYMGFPGGIPEAFPVASSFFPSSFISKSFSLDFLVFRRRPRYVSFHAFLLQYLIPVDSDLPETVNFSGGFLRISSLHCSGFLAVSPNELYSIFSPNQPLLRSIFVFCRT